MDCGARRLFTGSGVPGSKGVNMFLTVKEAMGKYRLCRNTIMAYAEKAGAIRRFGRAVRIDVDKFEAYFAG